MIGGMMHGYGWGDFGTFGWVGMVINLTLTIAVIVGVILLIVWLVRRLEASQGTFTRVAQTGSSAEDILKIRYARGEITPDQYQQMLSDLSKS